MSVFCLSAISFLLVSCANSSSPDLIFYSGDGQRAAISYTISDKYIVLINSKILDDTVCQYDCKRISLSQYEHEKISKSLDWSKLIFSWEGKIRNSIPDESYVEIDLLYGKRFESNWFHASEFEELTEGQKLVSLLKDIISGKRLESCYADDEIINFYFDTYRYKQKEKVFTNQTYECLPYMLH